MSSAKEELERVRAMMKKKRGGSRDPNEWRPDKAEEGKTLKWKFFVLPPTESMNNLWFYRHGAHFIENMRLECPRLHDEMQCPLCNYAFEVLRDVKDKDKRKEIRKALLPQARYAINIYFPAFESTPVELRGKVFWMSMPETVYNICEEVLYRDGPGDDPEEPEPWGLFYDPQAAHSLILQARKQGDYNTYESTQFSKEKRPITQKEGMIEQILSKRFDIPAKFDARDMDALQRIVNNLKGDPSDTPAPAPMSKPKTAAPTAKPTTASAKPAAKPTKPAVQEEVETEAAATEAETEVETPAPPVKSKPTTAAKPTPSAKPTAKSTASTKPATKPAPAAEVEVETEVEAGAVAEPEAAEEAGDAAGIPEDDPELAALLQKLKNE